MTKTNREWLSQLEEPYRTQALVNTCMGNLKKSEESLERALISAFVWSETPQGHAYWKEIHTDILHNNDTDHQPGHRSNTAR